MLPEVAVSSPRTIFATVDLPDPDSPTTAVVVPRATEKDTLSTAVKSVDRPQLPRILKTFVRSLTSITLFVASTAGSAARSSSVRTPDRFADSIRREAMEGAEATSFCV